MNDFYNSYQFNITESSTLSNHPLIKSIGHEIHSKGSQYYWDCKNSTESICLCQFTVSGEGVVDINGKLYKQIPGSVFLLERPGSYSYYISPESEKWEVRFISFTMSCVSFWNTITSSFGRVFQLPESNEVLDYWEIIFKKTIDEDIDNIFTNSLLAYTFIITLHRYLKQYGSHTNDSQSIELCIEFINSNYGDPISLVDIADAGNISPFNLNKKFKEVVGDTPLHYLIRQRIRNSMIMLHNSDSTISEIAIKCGFDNANYFAKVFRKYTGLSPTEFRNQKSPPIA